MNDIASLWIDGSPKAGKTSLIERLLQSNRTKEFAVVRLIPSDSVNSLEIDNEQSEECERYIATGAVKGLRIIYPNNVLKRDDQQIFESIRRTTWNNGFGEAACRTLICEGQPFARWQSTLRVFVVRPLVQGQSLINTIQIERSSGGLAKAPSFNRDYKNILRASVILINIYGEHERRDAELLIEQIRKLRAHPALKSKLNSEGDSGMRSLFVCNLADAKDKQLAKGLARIKRSIQDSSRSISYAS